MDKTYDEVYDMISESKQDSQVELVVARPIAMGLGSGNNSSGIPPGSATSGGGGGTSSKSYLSIRNNKDYARRRPSVTVTSPTSPDPPRQGGGSRFGGGPVEQEGKVQLKLWFDPSAHQLVVTVLRGCDISSIHSPTVAPNPYAKLCLLPDRR